MNDPIEHPNRSESKLRSKHFLRSIHRHLKSLLMGLPLTKIGLGLLIVVFSAWTLLHFYFANPSRMKSVFSKNADTVSEIEKTSALIDELFTTVTLSSNPNEMRQYFQSLIETDSASGLPPKLFVDYAFLRANEETKNSIKELYSPNSRELNDEYSASVNAYLDIYEIILELEPKIALLETNPTTVDSYLQDSISRLRQIEDSSIVDTQVLQRIYIAIQDSLLEYNETKDIEQFRYRYENVASEVVKEFNVAWQNSFKGQLFQSLKQTKTIQESLTK